MDLWNRSIPFPAVSDVAAVAVCNGKDLTKWEIREIPDPDHINYWGETALLETDHGLCAVIRNGKNPYAFVSHSTNGGNTWSPMVESNFEIASSKLYAGTLSNGKRYLIFNMRGELYRDTLAIAVGSEPFERVHLIRHGFGAPLKFWCKNEWCYPYAFEDREENRLMVVYTRDKESCELASLPIENL